MPHEVQTGVQKVPHKELVKVTIIASSYNQLAKFISNHKSSNSPVRNYRCIEIDFDYSLMKRGEARKLY